MLIPGVLEGEVGSSRKSPEAVPNTAECVLELRSHKVYLDRTTKRIYLDTTDYHAGFISFTADDLRIIGEELAK